jgi:hypothetical protein
MTEADRLTEGIANAIRAHDFDAVAGLLKVLAITDPHRAQAVYDTLELGLAFMAPKPVTS